MTEENKRAETARANDDRDLIEEMESAPGAGGSSGGNLQRDVATRSEEERAVGEDEGVTRVRASDKAEETNLPRFNQS